MKRTFEDGEDYLPTGFHMVHTGFVLAGDRIWSGKEWRPTTNAEIAHRVDWYFGVSRRDVYEN